jgi:DNA-binding CsgD family transcriptional regulator
MLVGRERELAVLRDHLSASLDGRGSVVLVSGEAGIGKSALAETVCWEAAERGALVLVGRCYDLSETPPYGPWIDLFGRCPHDNAMTPLPTAFAVRGTVGAVVSQAVLFQQVLDFFIALAAHHPLVLLLDDLHWADPASLDLLRFLTRNLAPIPLLLVGTYRSDELTRRHPLYQLLPLLVREAAATRLGLHPLGTVDTEVLVRDRFALPDAESARLVTYLDARGEGNPFFIGELLQTLTEDGVLHSDAGAWRLGDLTGAQVPPLLRQVIDGRLSRLDPEVQRLLTVGAVVGHVVPLAVWAAVAEVDEARLVEVVETGLAARLLVEMPEGDRVQFAHALVREALYAGIAAVRRRGIHQRAGEVLAARTHPDPDAVAHHFQQASDARAVEWLIAAGERARRVHAYPTAMARFDAALALMDLLHEGETPERAWLHVRLALAFSRHQPHQSLAHLTAAAHIAAHLDDPALEAAVRHLLGVSHCFVGEFAQGVTELRAGVAAVDALSPDDQDRLIRLLGIKLDTWRGTLILYLAVTGRLREAVTLGERNHPPDLTTGGWFRGLVIAYACMGQVEPAEEQFRRACERDRAARDYSQLSGTYLVYLLYLFPYHVDNLPVRQRHVEEGEAAWQQAFHALPNLRKSRFTSLPLLFVEGRWAELTDLIPSLHTPNVTFHGLVVSVIGPFARVRGDVAGAWQRVREILPQGPTTTPGGTMFSVAQQMQRLAVALALDAGELPTARQWLEAHDQWQVWSGAVVGRSEGHALWARYHREIGEHDTARSQAEHALRAAVEPRQPLALLAAHRLLGELETDAGRHDEAERHLQQSLRLADACAAPYERALTLLASAELQLAQGEMDAVRTLLDTVTVIGEALGAVPLLTRVNTLTQRVTTTLTAAPTYPAGLSAREVEVLRFVAEGLSNLQVGERLFLSPRTVEQHLRSIFNKTGVPSRTAAARWAAEQNLV